MDTVTVPLDWLNLTLGAVLPIATALITARFAQSAVKTLVLILLTVISTALQSVLQNSGDLQWHQFLFTTVFQFLISVGLHFGLLKPINITGESGVVAQTVPAGIGGPSTQTGPVAD